MSHDRDKLEVTYSIKIPSTLHVDLFKKLSKSERSVLNDHLKNELARAVHMALFDPSDYLKSD
jgi:hypothetical protein